MKGKRQLHTCYRNVSRWRCGWLCRSVGQLCKLKADERRKGSLKETAAALLHLLTSQPLDPRTVCPMLSLACPMSLSSPSAWCCLPVRTSHNEAVSDFTHMPLSCFHIANTDIRTGTEACLKTHAQRIHWWESCG